MSSSSYCHTVSCRGHGRSCCAAVAPHGASRSRSRLLHRVGCRGRVTVAAAVVAPRGASLSLLLRRVGVAVAIVAPPLHRVGRCSCRRCAAWGVAVVVVVPRGCRGRGHCAVWVSRSQSLRRVECRGRCRCATWASRSRSRSLRHVGRRGRGRWDCAAGHRVPQQALHHHRAHVRKQHHLRGAREHRILQRSVGAAARGSTSPTQRLIVRASCEAMF
jgi:hypothetical protein